MFRQTEVRDLDVIAYEEKIARLDIEMRQIWRFAEEVEPVGGIGHVAKQPVAGDAGITLLAHVLEYVVKAVLGQLHDDGDFAFKNVDSFDRKDKRVTDFF